MKIQMPSSKMIEEANEQVFFWDCYPELEISARQFSVAACSRKASSFTVQELSEFVTQKFYELYDVQKVDDSLVRSVESLRLDLRRWGIHYSSNKARPYFLGHERIDVVEHRKGMIDYFIQNENNYYRVSDGDNPVWISPTGSSPTIMICMCLIFCFFLCENAFFWKVMMNRHSEAMILLTNVGQLERIYRFLKREEEGL